MTAPPFAKWMLEQEARALLTRLANIKPFALQESMLPAANLLPASQIAIERFLMSGRIHLRKLVHEFIGWLRSPEGGQNGPEQWQQRFAMLRLQFNSLLTQFDMFNEVITQRSENETGVWLSGLDVISADALQTPFFDAPPVICYLDRGLGAAIRRARTRMPGGGDSPVAIVQMPRERMVGTGIASSLVHEVGHQGAALLGLVESLRPVLNAAGKADSRDQQAWQLWERWLSEIVADFWSVARAGVASTMGLMSVVSLPRAFVFRVNTNDPHPVPWIRVKLSAALGEAFYPQPAWQRLANVWQSYYPLRKLESEHYSTLQALERTIPALVAMLAGHRPAELRGETFMEALRIDDLEPDRLRGMLRQWRHAPQRMYRERPIVALAAIGQGRADGRITPEEESIVLGKLLTHWALTSTLAAAVGCAAGPTRHFERGDSPGDRQISTRTRRASWQI